MQSTAGPIRPNFFSRRLTFGGVGNFQIFWIILGGLPLYVPLFLWLSEAAAGDPFWLLWTNQLISMPHTWATYARLTRKISEKRVHWLFGWPAYASMLIFFIIATIKGFFLEVFTAVNLWQSYHYLRQVYGVGRFIARADVDSERTNRLSFWAYHLAIPLFLLGRWNLLFTLWKGKPSEYIIPVHIPEPIMAVCWLLAAVGLFLGLRAESIKFRSSRSEYNCTALLNLIVYYIIHWFGFLSAEFYVRGFLTITVFHAFQYLAIVFLLENRQSISSNFPTKRFLSSCPSGFAFVAFCIALFLIGQGAHDYLFSPANIWWAQFSATCLSTMSAHHYLVDTVLWRKKAGI
jgi:hypothetical protein